MKRLNSPVVFETPANAPTKVFSSALLFRPALEPIIVVKLAVYPAVGPNPAPAPRKVLLLPLFPDMVVLLAPASCPT